MFDGEKQCCICKCEPDKRIHRLTLSGWSKTFCEECFKNKKEKVMAILYEN